MTDRERVIQDLLKACAYFKSSFDAMNGTLAGETMYRWAQSIADAIALLKAQEPITGETSDGYHTFNELYHHRAVLFSVVVANYPERAWKSKKHHDGTMYDGMFIVGIDTPTGQATYHYDIDPYWDMFRCKVLDNAPEWDGHTPSEAIERIGRLARLKAQEPVRPGLGKIHHDDGSASYFLHCPFDGTTLVEGDNYCRKCGRAVKWE